MDTKVIEEKIDSLLDAVKNSREYEEYKKQEELLYLYLEKFCKKEVAEFMGHHEYRQAQQQLKRHY